MKLKRRNISPKMLQDLGLSKEVETISVDAPLVKGSEFDSLVEKSVLDKPASVATATPLLKTGRLDDDLIYSANHPGDFQRLGFQYFEWTNDMAVGLVVFTKPRILIEVSIDKNDCLVLVDWKNYALKLIGGNLIPMFPGELDDSNFSIVIKSGKASLGQFSYGTGIATKFEQNAVGTLDTVSSFTWPGKFRYIIRGPDKLRVLVNYKAAALPPYAIPAVVASRLVAYMRRG